jgi:hypothetical protein
VSQIPLWNSITFGDASEQKKFVLEPKKRSAPFSLSAQQGNATETSRKRKRTFVIDKDQNDSYPNAEPRTAFFWTLDLLKGERASSKMVLNQWTWHSSSDYPGIKPQFPSRLGDLKTIQIEKEKFVSPSNKVQFKISICPDRRLPIFTRDRPNCIGKANGLPDLFS